MLSNYINDIYGKSSKVDDEQNMSYYVKLMLMKVMIIIAILTIMRVISSSANINDFHCQ